MTNTQTDRPRILIIDDEPHIRNILSEALTPNYDCQTASSAEEGLDRLRRDTFSLVISDVNMDGITGLQMVPELLAVAPDTVVIMMSGAQTIENAVGALRVGAFDFLMKPFDLRLVQAAVRRGVDYHELRVGKRRYEMQLEEKVQERTAALLNDNQTTRNGNSRTKSRGSASQLSRLSRSVDGAAQSYPLQRSAGTSLIRG